MKMKSVKSEKYRMWFNDLAGTQQMLEEHSADGWHLIAFEMADGKFTFKKGEPRCYGYLFVVNGESYNFKVFTEEFEKIYEEGGLSLYRCEEDVPEAYETFKKRFSSPGQEKKWLEEMALQGYFLYMVEKPDYTFTMGEGETAEYVIERAKTAKGAAEYLAGLSARGLTYVWGDGRYHYLVRTGAISRESDDALSTPETVKNGGTERAQKPFAGLLAVGAAGLTAALGKMIYDILRFGTGLTEYAGRTWVDLLAAVICVGVLVYVAVKRRKGEN